MAVRHRERPQPPEAGDFAALFRACASFLKISPQLLGVVRRDPKIREAIRAQTSLFTRFPNCAAAADVEQIAARIVRLSR